MESMATGQTTDIIVVLQSIDTDSARVAGRTECFRREGGVDVLLVVLFIVRVLCWILGLEGVGGSARRSVVSDAALGGAVSICVPTLLSLGGL